MKAYQNKTFPTDTKTFCISIKLVQLVQGPHTAYFNILC